MPRPTQHTRERFIEAGIDLVQRRSFDGIGVAEIAKVSGAPKGSFYNHFESKEDFGVAMIETFVEEQAKATCAMYESLDGPPMQRLRAVLDAFRTNFIEDGFHGCLVGSMTSVCGSSPEQQRAVSAAFNQFRSVIEGFLLDAQRAGEISASADVHGLSRIFQMMAEGAIVLSKAHGSSEPFNDFISAFWVLATGAPAPASSHKRSANTI
ncbi:MAG: TetR/AcrR family transcriptional regulator [Pseudomonadota bacterium]